MNSKGPDYSGLEDRLRNFKDASNRYGITGYQDLMCLAHKHLCAVEAFVRGEPLTGEPIEQKLKDLINYWVLFLALLEDESKNPHL